MAPVLASADGLNKAAPVKPGAAEAVEVADGGREMDGAMEDADGADGGGR